MRRRLRIVSWCSLAAASGCLGPTNLSVPPADAGARNAACDHYYAAQYLRCGGPRLPVDEAARIQVRFEEACASALDVSPCEFPAGLPQECNFKGSLSGGASCRDGLQCASGLCQGQVEYTPGGP